MQVFSNILPSPWGSISTIVLLLIPFIIIGIDSYKMDEAERIRLTNAGKLKVLISRVIVMTLILSIVILIMVAVSVKWTTLEVEKSVLELILASIIVSFILVFFIYGLISIMINIFSVKTYFYIRIENVNDKIRIEKKLDRSTYLLKYGRNKSIFFNADDLSNTVINEELVESPKKARIMLWMYNQQWMNIILSVILMVASQIFINLLQFGIIGWILYIISMLIILLIFIERRNQRIINRLK